MGMAGKVSKGLGRAVTAAAHSIEASRCLRASALPIQDDLVFVDSRNGLDLAGNMLRVMLEVRRTYGQRYRLVTSATPGRRAFVRGMLDAYGLDDVPIRRYLSAAYYRELARAHYILTDVTLPHPFVKRGGQVILNTWHGTPLKCMGADSQTERIVCDNIQRNLYMADYLLFPSEYCLEKMAGAYSLNGLYKGKVVLEGYPRNEIFFDRRVGDLVRQRYGLQGMRVYAYMPTWRQPGSSHEAQQHGAAFAAMLDELDASLADDELVYLRLHDLAQKSLGLASRSYAHIRPYPVDIEAYEFLAGTDCLITDYSSVLYDYANSTGKIVLFAYDEGSYREGRGLYDQPEAFPFPKVATVGELVEELRAPKSYDSSRFRAAYCPHDGAGATSRLVQTVFEGLPQSETRSLCTDAKPTVLMYGGGYERNGITTSLVNLLGSLNADRRYVLGYSAKQMRGHESDLDVIEHERLKLCMTGTFRCATPLELTGIATYFLAGLDVAPARTLVDRYFSREAARCFRFLDIDAYAQFVGYERYMISLLQRASGWRVIWLHNDMLSETKAKGQRDLPMLAWAYATYDRVACVGKQLVPIAQCLGAPADHVRVVENCQDFEGVRRRSRLPIAVEEETVVSVEDPGGIEGFLRSHEHAFITIGRFSEEKDHELLIRAFERFEEGAEGCGLIIIGGYGPQYDATLARAQASVRSQDIMIIRNIANPMPILSRCDLFVLSSHYEGKPMVLAEAAALGIPVAVVDAPGCREFVREGKGLVVPRTEEGLAEAMGRALRGEVPLLAIDFDRYGRGALESFERLLDPADEA